DLYSLGCVLFHALTGRAPFDGREPTTLALLEAVIKGNAPEVTKAAPGLPPAVAQLIQELLARDPDKRPRSARIVADRLRQLEENSESISPPLAPPRDTSKLRRRPRFIGIGLGVLAIIAALLVSAFELIDYIYPPGPAGAPIRVGVVHSLTGNLS